MSKKLDPIVEAFIIKYGILNLLSDIGVRNIQRLNSNQIVATCPYHEDRKPSFSVNIENGLWTCFACDKHGDLIEMVKLSYNLEYKEARNFILARSGLDSNVNIDDITFVRDIFNNMEEQTANEVVKWPTISEDVITRMYSGPDPYEYLLGRGFSQSTIDYFECGYAKDYLGRGYVNQQRITIPGHDQYGRLCGFIGRTPIDATPKYLYTPGYPKSHTLFNLHRAKKYGNDQGIILVEGSLDAMRLHDLGFPNVCAILGSALSPSQQKLLRDTTDKVYLMFDNDAAGLKANTGALEAMKHQLDMFYVPLGKFNDPGDIRDKGTANDLLTNALSWFKYEMMKGGVK